VNALLCPSGAGRLVRATSIKSINTDTVILTTATIIPISTTTTLTLHTVMDNIITPTIMIIHRVRVAMIIRTIPRRGLMTTVTL
jgi:hypothetical protein